MQKLLTKGLEARFKKVGSQQEVADPIVIAKFFNPVGAGDWFATEWLPEEKVFFGYVSLFNDHNNEFGYFSLEELEEIRLPMGMKIQRDAYCSEMTLSEWKERRNIQ